MQTWVSEGTNVESKTYFVNKQKGTKHSGNKQKLIQ